jgi:hypothetical protein
LLDQPQPATALAPTICGTHGRQPIAAIVHLDPEHSRDQREPNEDVRVRCHASVPDSVGDQLGQHQSTILQVLLTALDASEKVIKLHTGNAR